MKMKKLLRLALCAAAILLAASCSSADDLANGDHTNGNKENNDSIHTRTVTLTATVGQNLRTGMKNDGDGYVSFYWHKGDAIGILTKYYNGNYGLTKFTTDDETGSTTATFKGQVAEDEVLQQYAVYPYYEASSAFTITEKSIELPLPGSYTFNENLGVPDTLYFPKTVDGTTIYPAHSTGMPMVGTIADDNVTFRHLGGLAVLRIDKMPCLDGQIEITADDHLWDSYTVSDLSSADAQISTASGTGGGSLIDISFGGTKVGSPAVFFLPLATGTYNNLTIGFHHSGGGDINYTIPYGSLTIGRGEIHAISLTTNTKGVLRNIRSLGNNEYLVNNRRFMDLGLESGLLWAEMNIGATSPYLPGDYFAWGETEVKSSCTEDNATWGSTAYPQTTLRPEDDAATANWGSGIRIPTQEDFEELNGDRTLCKWTYQYVESAPSPRNRYGIRIYNNSNENQQYIFLPASGVKYGSVISAAQDEGTGSEAYYWTSTAISSSTTSTREAVFLNAMDGSSGSLRYYLTNSPVYRGFNIRPVADK